MMNCKPDRQHVHTARHGNDGIVRETEQQETGTTLVANPDPQLRYEKKPERVGHRQANLIGTTITRAATWARIWQPPETGVPERPAELHTRPHSDKTIAIHPDNRDRVGRRCSRSGKNECLLRRVRASRSTQARSPRPSPASPHGRAPPGKSLPGLRERRPGRLAELPKTRTQTACP